jgi:hypothetical protein
MEAKRILKNRPEVRHKGSHFTFYWCHDAPNIGIPFIKSMVKWVKRANSNATAWLNERRRSNLASSFSFAWTKYRFMITRRDSIGSIQAHIQTID